MWGHRSWSTERLHLKVRSPGSAAARHCPVCEAGSWTASAVREVSKSSVLSTLWHCGTQRGRSMHHQGLSEAAGCLQPSPAPRASRKEQLHATFTRQQLAEPQPLHAPAEQLAPVIHLVTGASGYPAEQERPAKNTGPTPPPASASLPGSVLPRREAASDLPERSRRRAQLRLSPPPVTLTTNWGESAGSRKESRKD